MYTQFTTGGSTFVFNAPLIKISPDAPGAAFLAAIGGAYESEERHLVVRLLREAKNLRTTVQQSPPTDKQTRFIAALVEVIAFLENTDENGVTLYSSDKRP